MAAAVGAQVVAAVEPGAAGGLALRRFGPDVELAPAQPVGREQHAEQPGAVLGLDHRLEAPLGIGIVGIVVHHAGDDRVLAAEHVHQVVVPGALVLDQAQVRLVPGVAVAALGQAHPLVPPVVVALPEVPHPQLAAHAQDGAVVDDALAVRRARRPERHHDAGAVHRRLEAHQAKPHPVAERQAMVVERKQHDPLGIDVPWVALDNHGVPYGAVTAMPGSWKRSKCHTL